MPHKYQEGDEVVLKDGEGHVWFLPTGSRGIVFCQYATTPPAYEVTFVGTGGRSVGNVFYEDEIEAVQKAQPVQREAVSAAS